MFCKVVNVFDDSIEFDDGSILSSDHYQDCCEWHWLSFEDLDIKDFEGLEFDLSEESFFERIEGYGIALKPVSGHPVRIPGYAQNNGYYSSTLSLILKRNKEERSFDITECQSEK